MKLENYNNCIFCNSKNLIVFNEQKVVHNFYTRAIKSDFKLSDNFFKKMKVVKCDNCFSIQNSKWFSRRDAFKIFNQIYGQHNRSWNNVINFFMHGIKPNHGKLYNLLNRNFKIKNYGEYNSPFMGLFIDFFDSDYQSSKIFYKDFFLKSIKYLSSRQLAGSSKSVILNREKKTKLLKKQINNMKSKKKTSKNVVKTLVIDNSHLAWLYNDIYKSVNSRALVSELFETNVQNIEEPRSGLKFDLFGIFHTLDHTFYPKKIFDFALDNSKYVILYCHIDKFLEKQHLFSFTEEFLIYLKKKNINYLNLTELIEKNMRSPEMYFLCSRSKIKEIKL